jgi:hypothetical protein
MINKLTISGTPSEVKISLDCVPYDLTRGSYNSANWTLPTGSIVPCLFQQLTVKLGARSGGMVGMLEVFPSEFELTIDNKLKVDDITTQNSPYISQPVRSDFKEVSLKLSFPRFNAANDIFQTLFDINTEMCGSLVLVGPQIGATAFNHQYEIFMSSLRGKSSSGANISTPGPLTYEMEFEAYRPFGSDVFTTEFHAVTIKKDSEVKLLVQNAFGTNYLLEV